MKQQQENVTPIASQFQSNASKLTRNQDTDEDGNRMSILPSKKRPLVPSPTVKKAPSVRKAKVKSLSSNKDDDMFNEDDHHNDDDNYVDDDGDYKEKKTVTKKV